MNTVSRNRPTPYRRSIDDPLYSLRRRSWRPTLSRKYDTSVHRSRGSCRMMSCQKYTCRRTKPGTNCSPSPPASHTGAHHGIRPRGPCMGLRATSITGGKSPGTTGSAPERTHSRSTAPSVGAGRMKGRTWVWHLARRWSQTSATTYIQYNVAKRGCTYIYIYIHHSCKL